MSTCPPPSELERAYWSARSGANVVEMLEHVEDCEPCRATWRAIADLETLGARIAPPPFLRQEEVRTALLSRVAVPVAISTPRRWIAIGIGCAAAAVLAIVLWPTSPVADRAKTEVLAHADARWMSIAERPDEIIRLVDGGLTVTVPPLRVGERFRVITGDDSVTATDAAFDVTALGDRITAIRVIRGQAELRAGHASVTLAAGQTWHEPIVHTEPIVVPPADLPVPPPIVPAVVANIPADPHRHPARASAPDAAPAEEPPSMPDALVVDPTPVRNPARQAFDDAWTAMRTGDFQGAAKLFEHAMTIAVDAQAIEDATFWRGVAVARSGDTWKAAEIFGAFDAKYPTSVRAGEARVMRGWILFERGERDAARRVFESALRDPSTRIREAARRGLDASTGR